MDEVATAGVVTVDLARTSARYAELRAYMDNAVTDGEEFVCTSHGACRRSVSPGLTFAAGQLSYVGEHYDLAVHGVGYRILVVAMDTGRPDELVTLGQRRDQVLARRPESFGRRNPHMRGTTSALRVLLGGLPDEDRDGEYFCTDQSTPTHVLEAYAMANLRLCSAIQPGSTQSKGSATMSRNCRRHLEATIKILEPNVVVLQGSRLRKELDLLIRHRRSITDNLEHVEIAGVPAVLASFSHPSYPATKMHWGRVVSAPYLWDTVVPNLQRARLESVGVDGEAALAAAYQAGTDPDSMRSRRRERRRKAESAEPSLPEEPSEPERDRFRDRLISGSQAIRIRATDVLVDARSEAQRLRTRLRDAARTGGTTAKRSRHGQAPRTPPAPRSPAPSQPCAVCEACGISIAEDGRCGCS